MSKKFDEDDNPLNNLYSQDINLMMSLSLEYSVLLNTTWGIHLGVGFDHFSNASTSFPNIGINIPHFHTGLVFHFKEKEPQEIVPFEAHDFVKNAYWSVLFSLASKSAGQEFTDNDLAFSLALQRHFQISHKLTFFSSLDYMHNNTIRKILADAEASQARAGLGIGWQLEFGKTAFHILIGHYFYRPEQTIDQAVYHRFGLRYQIYKRWFVNVQLKSHEVRADVLEWGLGCRF